MKVRMNEVHTFYVFLTTTITRWNYVVYASTIEEQITVGVTAR